MAYEAMNNAGAMRRAADRHPQRQRHVDRARRSARCRPTWRGSSPARTYRGCATSASSSRKRLPQVRLRARPRAAEEYRARLLDRRHAVRGAGLLLRRPDRRPQPRPPDAGAARTCATHDDGPVLVHVVTQKGKGYAPGRGVGRQVPRRRQVRRRHRRAGQGQGQRAQPTPRSSPRA